MILSRFRKEVSCAAIIMKVSLGITRAILQTFLMSFLLSPAISISDLNKQNKIRPILFY